MPVVPGRGPPLARLQDADRERERGGPPARRRHGPTFVLRDIGMSASNGFEVPTGSALMAVLSGRGRAADIFAALHDGADD